MGYLWRVGGVFATNLHRSIKSTELLWLCKYQEKASSIQYGKRYWNTMLLPKVQS